VSDRIPASRAAVLAAVLIGGVAGATIGGAVASNVVMPTIMQADKSFKPDVVTVKVGTTISFLNDDIFDHNVFSESRGNEFDSRVQGPGETVEITLHTAGNVRIHCRIHPKMTMAIRVE